jgi:hypothetical protein
LAGKVYIELMHFALRPPALLPLMVMAGALAWPHAASAQGFSAHYGLVPGGGQWFARVSPGSSLKPSRSLYPHAAPADEMNIGGGYVWKDGQSLSLQLSRGPSAERLGLSVSYDWPRYYMRLAYDTGANPVPRDSLRFSAGLRF